MTGLRVPAGVVLVLLAAGCGSGSSPSVASLTPVHGGTTTQGTPADALPGRSSNGAVGRANVAMKVAGGVKFSACMRSHGLPDFPDPNAQGVIEFGSGSGVDPSSPKFRIAQEACQGTLPNGGRPSPQQIAKAQQDALEFSACMRRNGIGDFPDPTFSSGGVTLRVDAGPGSDLDPRSQLFQKAQAACRSLVPGKDLVPGPASAGGK